MHILSNIGNVINVGEYYVYFTSENIYYKPFLCASIHGKVNVNGDIFNINVYMNNIDNNGEIIYPKCEYVLDIYDYTIVSLLEKRQYKKVKQHLKYLLHKKLIGLH